MFVVLAGVYNGVVKEYLFWFQLGNLSISIRLTPYYQLYLTA